MIRGGVYRVPLMMLRELGCSRYVVAAVSSFGGHAACAGVCGVSCEDVGEVVGVQGFSLHIEK